MLLLAVLAVAAAVAAAVLVPLLLSRDAAPATGPGGSVPAVDDRCAEVGPATPC